MKILLSAYACEPDSGSEPGVGWNTAVHLAAHHDVWVITRSNNRKRIESFLHESPIPRLHPIYFDVPRWATWWKSGQRGVQLYYYLWQLGILDVARHLHREVGFDIAHHVTFVRYWSPSLLVRLPIPLVWGPVGGAERPPSQLLTGLSPKSLAYEHARSVAQAIGERDPLTRDTARRCAIALATTPDTAARLEGMEAAVVDVLSESALRDEEIAKLANPQAPSSSAPLVSVGRLLHWKGFQLALDAFARAKTGDAEFWIIGDGPERERLEHQARASGVSSRVRFWGRLSREETLAKIRSAAALVHPSLHDSGGWVCLEAMAASRPVICLGVGGPAQQVDSTTGFVIAPSDRRGTVDGIAAAMSQLHSDSGLAATIGDAGRKRVEAKFSWRARVPVLEAIYERAIRLHRGVS